MPHAEKAAHSFIISPNAIMHVDAKERSKSDDGNVSSHDDGKKMKFWAVHWAPDRQNNVRAKNHLNNYAEGHVFENNKRKKQLAAE